MSSKKPLISICIPTYNRCDYLKKTLDSIIEQESFDFENVELIISDNNSTDSTKDLCTGYVKQFKNIKYFRNDENIADKNFSTVLSKGCGNLLKLCNDTLLFNEGSLKKLLQYSELYVKEKPVIFMDNSGTNNEVKVLDNLESFLYQVSYNITWIGGFCIWKDDFEKFGNNYDGCDKKLWQVPVLLNYIQAKEKAIIVSDKLFTIQTVQGKNISYGLYKVFYENYLSFFHRYNNVISKDLFNWLEKDLLFSFFPYWMVQFKLQNKDLHYSDSENLVLLIKKAYSDKEYYRDFKKMYLKMLIKAYIKSRLSKLKKKFNS